MLYQAYFSHLNDGMIAEAALTEILPSKCRGALLGRNAFTLATTVTGFCACEKLDTATCYQPMCKMSRFVLIIQCAPYLTVFATVFHHGTLCHLSARNLFSLNKWKQSCEEMTASVQCCICGATKYTVSTGPINIWWRRRGVKDEFSWANSALDVALYQVGFAHLVQYVYIYFSFWQMLSEANSEVFLNFPSHSA